eukprot:4960033-Amphidinium_carterae.1
MGRSHVSCFQADCVPQQRYPPYAICVIAAVCFSIDSPAGLLYKLLCVDTVSGGSSVLGGCLVLASSGRQT